MSRDDSALYLRNGTLTVYRRKLTPSGGFFAINYDLSINMYYELTLDYFSITSSTKQFTFNNKSTTYSNGSLYYATYNIIYGAPSDMYFIDFTYYDGSAWRNANRSYVGYYNSGHFGMGVNSNGYTYFYHNGSLLGSVNYYGLRGTRDNYFMDVESSGVNYSFTQHIFRNEFYYIPDGYSVAGDFLPKEAYKDKEYYYTYK